MCLLDLPGSALERAADSVPGGQAYSVDLSKPEELANVTGAILAQHGPISLLFNNAVTRTGKGMDAVLEDWRLAMEVNFWGASLQVLHPCPYRYASQRC